MATKMTTRSAVEGMGDTARQMADSTQRSGRVIGGFLAETQEINTEFARKTTETWIEAFRKQAELNQRMVQRLYGENEGQTEAVRGLMRDWTGVYMRPFASFGFGPFAYLREGMQLATRNAERAVDATRGVANAAVDTAVRASGGFPIAGYDEMTVAEVAEKLDSLTADELKRVREYEVRNKNRETLIDQIDRRIKAIA